MGIKRLALSLFTLGGVELDDQPMLELQSGTTETTEDVLLHRVCPEEGSTDLSTTAANGKSKCLECGDDIPVYSNFFCETHMIEFLMYDEETERRFTTTKAQFTNSHSQ